MPLLLPGRLRQVFGLPQSLLLEQRNLIEITLRMV